MCTYGTIMSVLIPTMIGKHHLKLDMPGEFSNKVLQKCLTTTDEIDMNDATPSHDQTIRMRKFFEEGKLTTEVIQAIMSEEKPNQKEKITLSMDRVEKFIPKNIKINQREDFICKALEHYNKYLRQRADRDSR